MRAATGSDLSGVAALTTLLDRPGLSIRELAAVLGITHSGAVRLVDRLAARGS
jgi:MarR family transcriptional regulator, negative regulator of the multidrug operon emrRAB